MCLSDSAIAKQLLRIPGLSWVRVLAKNLSSAKTKCKTKVVRSEEITWINVKVPEAHLGSSLGEYFVSRNNFSIIFNEMWSSGRCTWHIPTHDERPDDTRCDPDTWRHLLRRWALKYRKTEHEPREPTRHDAGKPTPSVATPIRKTKLSEEAPLEVFFLGRRLQPKSSEATPNMPTTVPVHLNNF